MQFILTQQEFDDLVPIDRAIKAERAVARLREMVVGNNCVHFSGGGYWYCDQCPLSNIGGKDGEMRPDYEMSKSMCSLPRRYSK